MDGHVDSLTVSLHGPNGRHLPAVRAVQRDCEWPLKNCGSFYRSRQPTIHWDWGNPNLYLDQPITKGWDHVSYPTVDQSQCQPRLRLCISVMATGRESGHANQLSLVIHSSRSSPLIQRINPFPWRPRNILYMRHASCRPGYRLNIKTIFPG